MSSGNVYSILGSNGSGKSTLLQICSGYLTPSQGKVVWAKQRLNVTVDKVYTHVAFCTPYMTLYDDFTLLENIRFFLAFKKLRNNLSEKDVVLITELEGHSDKLLRNFSSGMKQRVKLALAVLSDADLLLLDEPSSHLDAKSIQWYQTLLQNNTQDRITVIASNSELSDLVEVTSSLRVSDYK